MDWLVDTGCTVTLVSSQVFNQLPVEDRPDLAPSSNELVSADGSSINSYGEALFNITIGHKTICHRAIGDIKNDGLIGLISYSTSPLLIDQQTFCQTNFAEYILQHQPVEFQLRRTL